MTRAIKELEARLKLVHENHTRLKRELEDYDAYKASLENRLHAADDERSELISAIKKLMEV